MASSVRSPEPGIMMALRGGLAWRQPWGVLRRWYADSLINQVALKAQLLITAILLVIGAVCYTVVFELVETTIIERLQTVAQVNVQRLQNALDNLVADTEALSRRPMVVQGLSQGQESAPPWRTLFHEFRNARPELKELSLYDAQGRLVATSYADEGEALSPAPRIPPGAKPSAYLRQNRGQSVLRLGYPVSDEREALGYLVAEIELSGLARHHLRRPEGDHEMPVQLSLSDHLGDELFRNGRDSEGRLYQTASPLGGSASRFGLNLELIAATPASQTTPAMIKVGLALAMVGFLTLVLTYILTRSLAENIVRPLSSMARRAQEIAAAGRAGLHELDVDREDEVGAMGRAFNEMVASLRCSYDTLEDRVRARTNELDAAREQLSGVLAGIDDMVYSVSADFQEVDYVSPASLAVTGWTPDMIYRLNGLLNIMVHPEDRDMVQAARCGLLANSDLELKYRILREDGSLRWVLDRCHLVFSANGVITGVTGLIRDVTDSVEAEASLRLRDRALASSSCGVVIADMTRAGHPILYVNAAFERITGYTAGEVIGRNCSFLQGPEADQEGIEEIRRALTEHRECRVILRNYRKNGELFWNELMLSPVRDGEGRVSHFIGVQNDISDSIKASQALEASERRLALTIDALDEGVWDWDIVSGAFYTSPSWAHVLGLDPAQVPRDFSALADALPGDWFNKTLSELQAYIEGVGEAFYYEHQMRKGDGSLVWVANRGRIVERNERGQPLRLVGTIIDISERFRNSQQIIGLMRQLDAIFTLSPDAFAYFDETGHLSFVNPAFERMTGIRVGEVAGLSLDEFQRRLEARADPAHVFPDLDSPALERAGEDDGELIHLIKPTHRVLLTSRRGGGHSGFAVVYMRDVTRETEVDRMKSEFLSTAAHELRTPMASIMGFSELLMLRDFDRSTARDVLDTIHRQARRLTDLINELLDLARIEARAGKDFHFQRQPVLPILRDAMAALNVEGDRSRMVLHASALPEGSDQADVDPAKLQQAFLNVLSNAYKYSPAGGAIDIDLIQGEDDGGQTLGIRVRDHGIGMTEDQLTRVFERFFRADPSGNIPGTGLGMSLVKEIMERHDGKVAIASEYGKGTTVTLWLPPTRHDVAPDAPAHSGQAPRGNDMVLWLDAKGDDDPEDDDA